MRRASTSLATCLLLVAACTPLRPLDPDHDARVRSDAGRLDGGAPDAPGLDAHGLDARDLDHDAPTTDAAVPPDAHEPDAGCVGGPRCIGSTLRSCDRGSAVDVECPLGCVDAATPHCGELVPSNIPPDRFVGPTLEYVIMGDFMFDTSMCPVFETMGLTLGPVAQPDGPEICVMGVAGFTIPAGRTMRVVGSRPFALAVQGSVTIDGVLDVSAVGTTAGAGGGAGGALGGGGAGPTPGASGMRGAGTTTDDGGGGGGAGCGNGGDGGDSMPSTGGAGGRAPGSTTLDPLVAGSGGGAGSGASTSAYGRGGAGGGAVQITALGSITVRGSILASGGAGQRSTEVMSGALAGAGGGGGSGGSVLLEAPSVQIEPDAWLIATGGGGGAGGGPTFTETEAEDGGALERRARGGVGGGSYGASGGESGAVDTPDGLDGASHRMAGNGGGGGGGAGCIVIRSVAPPSTAGVHLSPSSRGLSTLPLVTR